MKSDRNRPGPRCASFDQYRNFKIRGDRFRELVLALPGIRPV
jgi:UDP-N-acetylmuramoylalanine--D-glutamate ligase